jgi:hypothetical protein
VLMEFVIKGSIIGHKATEIADSVSLGDLKDACGPRVYAPQCF